MKFNKIFEWIWNFVVASIIAGCIIITVAYSISTYSAIEEIGYQIEELYEISVQNQNTISKNREQNERIKKEQPLSYDYLMKVTVRLFGKVNTDDNRGWLGTGIIVKVTEDFTYILTNKHIATIGAHVYVNKDGKIYKVEILKNSAFDDLALVRMNGNFSDKKAVRGFADHVIQEKVYSVGMYLGNHFIYAEGTVAGKNGRNDLLINLPSASGCSGSGIFNSKGEVVGLLYGGYILNFFVNDTSKAVCVPSSAIKVFLKEFLNV